MSNRLTGTTATATLQIARHGADDTRELVEFEVPFEPGASVLDGLRWIRSNRDSSLAFRFSCINANVCRECTMQIDGEVAYACTARLKPGVTRLEPLPGKRVLCDLIVETVPFKERYRR